MDIQQLRSLRTAASHWSFNKAADRLHQAQPNSISCTVEGFAKESRRGGTDLAFLLTESVSAADLEVETPGFKSLVPVASPQHPLSAKRSVHTRDLSGQTILFSILTCGYESIFERVLKHEVVDSYNEIECSSVAAIKSNVINGPGVAVLPEVAITGELRQRKLVILPRSEGGMDAAILMIRFKVKGMSRTLHGFMEVTGSILKQ